MPVASWFTEPNERAAVALTLGCALAAVGCGGSDATADEGAPRGWQDRFIYQILVDRFEDGDPSNNVRAGVEVEPDDLSRHQGGDWAGVTQRLDYVKRLGAGAIWISPIVRNVDRTESEDGYHGYWAEDFTEVNPRYGTLDELQELVRQAHARDLRVIIDVVTNHAGRVFNYDLDGDGQLDEGEVEPPYRSQAYDVPLLWGATRPNLYRNGERWELGAAEYRRRGFGGYVGEGRIYGDFGTGLRDLDTENQEVFDALLETYVRWVELTDVDGFRIDAVPHIEDSYWAEFCRRLRTELAARGKRDFMLLGEVFEQQAAQLARFTGEDELDSVFDFPFKFSFIDQVVLGGAAPASARAALVENREILDGPPQALGTGLSLWKGRVGFADNHDVPRIRSLLDDPFATDLVMTAVFTLDAIPAVYYGTEQDFDGAGNHSRRERLWDSGFSEDGATFRHIQQLAALRQRHEALRRGELTLAFASETGAREADEGDASDESAGLVAWERHTAGERLLVVLSTRAGGSASATFRTGFPEGTQLRDQLGSGDTSVVGATGSVRVELPPRSSRIFAR